MAVEIYMLTMMNYWNAGLGSLGNRRAMLDGLADEQGILGEFGRYLSQAMNHKAFERSHLRICLGQGDHNRLI